MPELPHLPCLRDLTAGCEALAERVVGAVLEKVAIARPSLLHAIGPRSPDAFE
jgi:hypothetical protein